MSASNERRLKQNYSLSLPLGQMKINFDLSDSIEPDKIIYEKNFNTRDSNHCF